MLNLPLKALIVLFKVQHFVLKARTNNRTLKSNVYDLETHISPYSNYKTEIRSELTLIFDTVSFRASS